MTKLILEMETPEGGVLKAEPQSEGDLEQEPALGCASAEITGPIVEVPYPVPMVMPHGDLTGRDEPDQHPIDAISGLRDELNSKTDAEEGKGLSTNDFTDDYRTKLDEVEKGAERNVIVGIKRNGLLISPVSREVDIQVPTNVSELTNDEGFIDKSVESLDNFYTKTTIDDKLAGIIEPKAIIVQSLPESGEAGTLYLVPSEGSEGNIFTEYIWVEGSWEMLGSMEFRFDIVQNASGISINGTALQSATSAQAGLMTGEQAIALSQAGTDIQDLKERVEAIEAIPNAYGEMF